MTRHLVIAALLAVSTACSIESSKTTGPVQACRPATDINGTHATCSTNAECCSYNCRDGFCFKTPTAGGVCRTTVDCADGMTCKGGLCAAGLLCHDDGDVCTGAAGANLGCCNRFCTGSSSTSYGKCTLNIPPAVTLSAAATAPRNVQLTVTGSVSDPDMNPVPCTWTVTAPGRTPVTMYQGDCTGATTLQFTPLYEGPYTISLEGDDGFRSDQDRNPRPVKQTVTVEVENTAPVAAMTQIAGNETDNVYANLDANGQAIVTTVDGGASWDLNDDHKTPLALSYAWSLVPTSTATLTNETAARPTLTANAAGDYVLSLVVTDPAWDSTRDPVYRGRDRQGVQSTPLTVAVHVGPYVTPLKDGTTGNPHDLIDADYTKTVNKIVLLGHDYIGNPGLWVYDVATGLEGKGIAVREPPNGGYSNGPSAVGVTSDGTLAVVGDTTYAWKVPLDGTTAITRHDPTVCTGCSAVLPIGDVVVVGTRHAFFFNSSASANFVDLDLNNNSFVNGGYAGRSGATCTYGTTTYLFVGSGSNLDRFTVNASGSSYSSAVYSGCTTGSVWARLSGDRVFDACGNKFSNTTDTFAILSDKLSPAPVHLDSLADGRFVTLDAAGDRVYRWQSTFVSDPADYLPIWADAGGGKHQAHGMFAFLAADGSRIVFLKTSETTSRYGVFKFGP